MLFSRLALFFWCAAFCITTTEAYYTAPSAKTYLFAYQRRYALILLFSKACTSILKSINFGRLNSRPNLSLLLSFQPGSRVVPVKTLLSQGWCPILDAVLPASGILRSFFRHVSSGNREKPGGLHPVFGTTDSNFVMWVYMSKHHAPSSNNSL